MGKHVIVGAGQVGSHLAGLLVGKGHDVTVVTRSGSGPDGVRKVAANAADRATLIEVTQGADTLYNCMNPRYHEWATVWPPVADALLGTAEETGAALVTLGCLYGYGPFDGPMTEDTPMAATGTKGKVRAKMWHDMLAAHEAGRARVTEVRGSDYYGPGSTDQAYIGTTRFVRPLLAGKRVWYFSNPDITHSWTYLPDVARALAIAGTDERALGRAWHIPSADPFTTREFGERLCELAGARRPRITEVPRPIFNAVGAAVPMVREMRETRYQFDKPYILDSSAFQTTFGMAPTSMEDALKAVLAAA
ncbi:NAD-dependent epimerase/dehydratase family protein [Actinomadura barringtoniae]|uniref:NAD-dependent epimerase/dehydratase family protein n=1 Tax=Actinomadura barringtoniae TaxID=1427535 RepID=A0A939PMW3_9ACTN|nr:NAD-dependent epimerase/dehydratase family protein [Actinomadura barringtoniae]MBO2452059.1 NAD-dependent epimerase/dehydratase family protein [Actinomadura barringtoniae]